MNQLLAKGLRGGTPITLLRHTHDVMDAVVTMFGSREQPTRLGRSWLRFFKIPQERFPLFQANLLAAAAFHDLGKANDGFQDTVLGKGEQVVRHEHLSALMLADDAITACLSHSRPDIDVDLVLSAVLTHHLKASYKEFVRPLGARRTVHLLTEHDDFRSLWRCVSERLELSPPLPDLPGSPFWAFRDDSSRLPQGMDDLERRRDLVRERRLRPLLVALRKDENRCRRRLLWAVRSALIAADAVGSALPRVGLDMKSWIEAVFAPDQVCDESFIADKVIKRRVEELQQKNKKFDWSKFQNEAAGLPRRALLLAPCGSGKTLAAWKWIEAQLMEPAARVLFLYPTRATAKEGFRDYVSWAPEAAAALMHGTSAFDLQDLFANPDDPRHENHYEVDRRLYALGFWTRRVFSATVDQFLAFLQYGYGAMCMLPVLADSVVVIDEVHSFDRAMFSALKEFLNQFDVPVLCMTATLPNARRVELVDECQLTPYDDKPGELEEVANAPRYRLRRTTEAEVPGRIKEALAEGRRVMWVVNQVRRAQQAALSLACDFRPDATQEHLQVISGIPLLCYHSRYRLIERVKRHNEVVEAFRPGRPAVLAITTQVCEMSLDMDADLLVTERCPITSLIQRMGRCNRQREPRAVPYSGEVLVYEPDNVLPYDAAALTGFKDFLDKLAGRDSLNQVDLEKALEAAPSPPALGDVACSFINSGPYAMGGEEDFRDSEEFNVQAVLQAEVSQFLHAPKKEQPGFVVPVPRRLGREQPRPARWPAYLGIAPNGHYHLAMGFCDQSLAEMGGTN